jgi:hypothetical protein
MIEIAVVIARLAAQAQSLVTELLPSGHREGVEWVCPSAASPFGCSLSVRLTGARAGVWCAWASGEAGDILDLIAAVRFGGNKSNALRWARQRLGCDERGAAPVRRGEPDALPPPDGGEAARSRAAARLFFAAQPTLAGTAAERYLKNRAIDLAPLGRQPRSLRFHWALWNNESGRSWPALLAAISDPVGRIVAIHRTWLAPDGGGKAPLEHPKMTLGPYRGGAVRLWRGQRGKPLSDAPPGETVVIGEGLEDCLTAACAVPEYRILCAVSLSNLGAVALPPAVRTVILLGQNDAPDSPAARTLSRAVAKFRGQGRIVKLARPPARFKDINDVQRHSAGAG